jgi:hypothetical protein
MAITEIFQSVYLRVKYILETRDSIVVAYLLPQTPLVKKVGEVDSLVSRPHPPPLVILFGIKNVQLQTAPQCNSLYII